MRNMSEEIVDLLRKLVTVKTTLQTLTLSVDFAAQSPNHHAKQLGIQFLHSLHILRLIRLVLQALTWHTQQRKWFQGCGLAQSVRSPQSSISSATMYVYVAKDCDTRDTSYFFVRSGTSLYFFSLAVRVGEERLTVTSSVTFSTSFSSVCRYFTEYRV